MTDLEIGESEYHSFPLTETYPVDPMDTYALTKLCGEETARSFARRFAKAHKPSSTNPGTGTDIYVFRIGNVIEPHEYVENFPTFLVDLMSRKRNAWSYVDARELGKMCDCAIKTSDLGFQVRTGGSHFCASVIPPSR